MSKGDWRPPPTWADVDAALARALAAEAEARHLRGVLAREACRRLANILASRCRPLDREAPVETWEDDE